MPTLRPRISILTALLLTTIVAMTITLVQFWREVAPLRSENKRLNEERGTLVIGDPSQLHAIRIPSRFAGEGRQSFRVFVPPRQTYMAFVHVNSVPKAGLPEPKNFPDRAMILGSFQGRLFGRLGPGEHQVTIKTVHRGGTADIALIIDSLDASANTPKDRWPTVVPETYSVFGDGVGEHTVANDGTTPFVLLRTRIQGVSRESLNVSYTTPEPDYPLDGMMLWLERATTPIPKVASQ